MEHRDHPIWAVLREQGRYNLTWLAEKTGFSHSHVKAIASGRAEPSLEFRRACAQLLNLPEFVLFRTRPAAESEPTQAAAS